MLYGAMRMDGNAYRVKTTVKRLTNASTKDKAYAYRVESVEVLTGTLGHDAYATTPRASTPASMLLRGVRKIALVVPQEYY